MNKKLLAVITASLFSNVGVVNAADYTPVWGTGPGVALGSTSSSAASNAVALGGGSEGPQASGSTSFAALYGAKALGENSIAIGLIANATETRAVAIGAGTRSDKAGSVALGDRSSAIRAGGSFGSADGVELTEAVGFGNVDKSGTNWRSNTGVASIGSDTISRQLTGLAAGSQDNDAVNVAQLKSLQQSSLFGSGTTATYSDSTGASVTATNATTLGDNTQVQANGAVAIGANSIATSRLDSTGAAPTGYLMPSSATSTAVWQADANYGVVSFGGSYANEAGDSVEFNRQITGVAAGSEDNDAVNVAQLKEVNNQVQGLITGDTKVSTIQLTSDSSNPDAPTIGLRYEAANSATRATETNSVGRLVYNNIDATGTVIGTETIATLSDGITLRGGNMTSTDPSVKVDLNQGISFLGDEYLVTSVVSDENGGAQVQISASQSLKDFLTNSGVTPSDPSNPGTGSSGSSGNVNLTAAQQAALNGNFANGITVDASNGYQEIRVQQGNVDMGGNRIQNVGDGVAATDAVNKRQLDNATQTLRNKINDVDKDLRAGVAMAMAVGGLPQAYMPGKSILAMSAGTYHGQGGFALGLSHATENRSWVFKGAATVDTRGNFGGTVGAGYQF